MPQETNVEQSAYIELTNLTRDVTEHELHAMLLPFGPVLSYVRPTSGFTGRPGTTAYAEMAPSDARAAVEALHGREQKGRVITLAVVAEPARDMEPSDRGAHSSTPRRTVLAPSTPTPRVSVIVHDDVQSAPAEATTDHRSGDVSAKQ
ncbi:MAG: RNA-binding protein [Dehalococcoidia bacterium]